MVKLFWWKNTPSISNPRSIGKAFKRTFHYKLPFVFRNFGDELSPVIIAKLTDQKVCFSDKPEKLVSLGSILHLADSKDSVWGTGLLRENMIPRVKDISIFSVRGPLTKSALVKNGYNCPSVYGDPGLLVPYLWKNESSPKYKIGVIPHWSQIRHLKKDSFDTKSINLIDVSNPWNKVIDDIQSCEIILSTSLHGLILADAYNIPRAMFYIDTPPDSSWFKYEDYSASIDATLVPYDSGGCMQDIVSLSEKAALNPVKNGIVEKLLEAAPFKLSRYSLN
ncbi:polysaccharide pyruvyl transferase family protein [Nodosilinea sp. PGN35]|uniref:polysaccharide pyruvyl transferase family protein n=1 Tax=Nodosilinea sp. PGN35 TaxID=3020489 RepID=UPI0023B2638F|nr:polysaccharide pyruvyl transferase family protein [Nodosilinea sp. TSF1-S3]MDF0367309.1 polysaccharide pyruvyl transferase family protein [Nodosilinea sp. TSF1-S3]